MALSKAKLRQTLRGLNALVEATPDVAETFADGISQIKRDLTNTSADDAVAEVVESIELGVNVDEFLISFDGRLREALKTRAAERAAEAAKAKAEAEPKPSKSKK